MNRSTYKKTDILIYERTDRPTNRQPNRLTHEQTDRPTYKQTYKQSYKPEAQSFASSPRQQTPNNRLTDRRTSLEKILADRRDKLDKLAAEISDLDRVSRKSSTDSKTRSSSRRSSLDRSFSLDRRLSCSSDSSSRRSQSLYSSDRSRSERASYRRPILETCGTLPEPPPRRASQKKSRPLKREDSMDTFIANLDKLQEDLLKVRPKPRVRAQNVPTEDTTPQRRNRQTNRQTDREQRASPRRSSPRRNSVSSNNSDQVSLRRENSFKIASEIIQKYRSRVT